MCVTRRINANDCFYGATGKGQIVLIFFITLILLGSADSFLRSRNIHSGHRLWPAAKSFLRSIIPSRSKITEMFKGDLSENKR